MRSVSATKRRQRKGARIKYVYCIIPEIHETSFGKIGIDGEDVYTINFKEIAAVVSDASQQEYEILDHGIAHQKVVESIVKKYAAIPMGFGQVAPEDDIKALLSRNYLTIRKSFEKIEGKKELGLKILWNMEKALVEISNTSDRVRLLKKHVAHLPESRSYKTKIELGKAIAQELARRGDNIAENVVEQLGCLADEVKINNNFSDEMILNAAFLVKSDNEDNFDEAVDALEMVYGDQVRFNYVVSPPYNFIDFKIRR